MKALSIKQPWAWLICAGYKDVENRSWRTDFRGRIYVHAGKKADEVVWADVFRGRVADVDSIFRAMRESNKPEQLGAIIGEVDIVGCKFRFGEENDNLYSPWHVPGQYGLILKNPVLYDKPIPYKGQLGFFEVKL